VVIASAEPSGFAEFWAAYPRKTAKDDARKAWQKAVRRAPPAEIIAGLARATFDRREFPRFVPHPATWLNGGRWQDEAGSAPGDDWMAREAEDLGLLAGRHSPDRERSGGDAARYTPNLEVPR